jgi:polysaccharide export outer membrane protein
MQTSVRVCLQVRGRMSLMFLVMMLWLPSALPAQQTVSNVTPRADSSLHLGPGDLVEVSVYNVPDLSAKTRVSASGDISLPLIDSVHVGGLTAEAAQNLIQKRLSGGGFVKDPHVSLLVDQYTSDGVSVLGEVVRPGVYPVLGEQRLFDLISSAGGLTEKAGRSISISHRDQSGDPVTLPLTRNLADNAADNVPVYAGDTIIVRKADVVYVVGDVGKPSGFLMDSGNLTVLQAIALAGGTTRTAKLGSARIIRKGSSGMSETQVHLKQILEAKAPDMPMQADDILFVPTSAAKVMAGRTIEAALQAATAVSVIAVHP